MVPGLISDELVGKGLLVGKGPLGPILTSTAATECGSHLLSNAL